MSLFARPETECAARLLKLQIALEQIHKLVREELRSNVGPPISPVVYDIQGVLDSLEIKTP